MIEKMDNYSIEEILDELSLIIIDISPSDLQDIALIHDYFDQLTKHDDVPKDWIPEVDEAKNIAEKLIFDEQPFDEGKENIIQAIQALQNRLHEKEEDTAKSGYAAGDGSDKSILDDEITQQFIQNQLSSLEGFEESVLELEKGNNDAEKHIQRYLHTLKGETGLLGLMPIQQFIHDIETAISEIKSSNEKISVDGLLAVKDYFKDYFKSMEGGNIPVIKEKEIKGILSQLHSKTSPKPSEEQCLPKDAVTTKPAAEYRTTAVIQTDFSGDASLLLDFITESFDHLHNAEVILMDIETNPEDKENLNAIFRAFHTIKGVSSFIGLSDVGELSHRAETMLDQARKGEILLAGVYIDLTFDSIDMLKEMIENVKKAVEGERYETSGGYVELLEKLENPQFSEKEKDDVSGEGKKLGEILVESGKANSESIKKAAEKQRQGDDRPIGEILVSEGAAEPKEVVKALRAQTTEQGEKKDEKKASIEKIVKVSTTRLDSLIDMVGELVIAHSMVAEEREIQETKNQRLSRNVSHLGKIVRELQELSTSLRMVSVKATFQKMARLVHDLSKKNKKSINFLMLGEDTELDRNVVDEIGDPLIHMVRNSVDHGIEMPDVRRAAGKSEKGRVALNAFHRGGNVVIEISDDGKGLDCDRVLQKATQMGVVKESETLSDHEIYNLIFHPGLSTAKKVTDVSGRGVGMDVVKKSIESLRGQVDINSSKGKGTTMSLMLPLTLAIIDGMIIRVGSEKFIVPTTSVIESFRPDASQITNAANRGKLVNLRGDLLPLYNLGAIFGITNAIRNASEGSVIVLKGIGDGKSRGFVVDELISQQQVVIKSIGKGIGELEGISGGAIMGDGKVGLILDPAGIVRIAENHNNGRN